MIVLKPNDSNDKLLSEDVDVINAFKPIYLPKKNQIKAFSYRNIKSFFSFRNIKMVNEVKPDIIHFTNLYPHLSLFTFMYKLHKKYPMVCTLHSTPKSPLPSPAIFGFPGFLLQFISIHTRRLVKADEIIVHTDENKDMLLSKGVSPSKVTVIPHGAYTFLRDYADPECETKSKGNTILFFGYITKNKGIEHLIKAAPFISKEVPDIKIIIAGEGQLPNIIEDRGGFEIHNEYIPDEKVAELFQRAKVVVLPYIYHQGHSGVINVARAFGKPAVVTDVGDLPNLVEDGEDGLVVPPKDPEALANAIIKLLKDERLREKMGENASRKAEKLSWDNIAKKHIQVYEESNKGPYF